MTTARKPLYQRLPELYRIRDEAQLPAGQLKAYLDILDGVMASIRDDIEALYHDFFIETCSDWTIPYLADLLGTSHLSGETWTLRADVARTVHHRRRKGTLGAIASLTYALSGWAVHTVELRDRLVWNQHLNHQRPDAGGSPPVPLQIRREKHISGAVRGGTLTLRDPALLSLFNGPFDPFAHVADVKPLNMGAIRYNLPNLGIFIWRLQDYTVPVTRPFPAGGVQDLSSTATGDEARFALRFEVHPLGEPMVLFNTHRFQADDDPPSLTHMDAVPGPMPVPRLTDKTPAGRPREYVAVVPYTADPPDAPGQGRVGLTLHVPQPTFGGVKWTCRGGNLCAWETDLRPRLREHEIVVDPDHGRLLIGVGGAVQGDEAEPLAEGLYVSATYGFSGSTVGATGAHPVVRADAPGGVVEINHTTGPGGVHAPNGTGLRLALDNVHKMELPRIIEIQDSRTYDLDIKDVAGVGDEGGRKVLRLGRSLHIRAASGQRPMIRLKRPLGFRPHEVTGRRAAAIMAGLYVKLEGLYVTWDKTGSIFTADADMALIAQAALNRLVVHGCTLDPGSHQALDGSRHPARRAMNLTNDYGFSKPADEAAFDQTPKIDMERSICGPLAIDDGYELGLVDAIVDAAGGPGDTAPALAVHAATGDLEKQWGPELTVSGMTCFGRMRVADATGEGGIWVHTLQVRDDQQGCIKFSYFSGNGDRLPQFQACVFGPRTVLSLVSDVFGQPGYAQLRLRSDGRILEQGPHRDAMGAFGYLRNTHKWKNINIRYREFMPVGIRPVLIPVT